VRKYLIKGGVNGIGFMFWNIKKTADGNHGRAGGMREAGQSLR